MGLKRFGKIILLMISLIGCSNSIKIGTPIGNSTELIKDDLYFFPKGVFLGVNDLNDLDGFYRKWFSRELFSMKEPSLSNKEIDFECAFRFLWLRSFHHPMAIRIERRGDAIQLFATELAGKGGYDPGKIKQFIKKELSINDFDIIKQFLIDIDFWNMSSILPSNNLDGTVTLQADGAEWIFEVRDHQNYHVVKRLSPDDGKFKKLCLLFFKLSGFTIASNEIY